jgi:hypothetical protein
MRQAKPLRRCVADDPLIRLISRQFLRATPDYEIFPLNDTRDISGLHEQINETRGQLEVAKKEVAKQQI